MPDCIIVEDEPIAADVIEQYLQEFPEFRLVGRFTNPLRAIPFVMKTPVDLIFLDVQMPGMNGLELIKTFRSTPNVIFTTAYPEYALDGYEVSAIDYLLKPISFTRFVVALNKARERIHRPSTLKVETGSATAQLSRFYKSEGKTVRVDLAKVHYIEAMENYVKFILDKEVIVVQSTMKSLESELPKEQFMRVHRSYIVNLTYLRAVDRTTMEILDSKIPIGRAYRSAVGDYLNHQTNPHHDTKTP